MPFDTNLVEEGSTIPWKRVNPNLEIAIWPLAIGICALILVVAGIVMPGMPLYALIVSILIGIPCLALGIHFLRKKPEGESYAWVEPLPWSKDRDESRPNPWAGSDIGMIQHAFGGDSEDDTMAVPSLEGFGSPDKEIMEMSEIASRYMPMDPRNPFSHSGQTMRSTLEFHQVPEGGGCLIGGDSMNHQESLASQGLAGSPLPEGVLVMDQGDAYVIDVENLDLLADDIEIVVVSNEMHVYFPVDSETPGSLTRRPNKPDRRSFGIMFEEELIPNRAWADLWPDILRITLPKDRTSMYTPDEDATARVIVRENRAPPLPPSPVDQRFQPLIPELYVHEHDDRYEVVATLHKKVQREFKYGGKKDVLSLICITVRFKANRPDIGGKRVLILKKVYSLKFPSPIDWTSMVHTKEGDTWHIWVPKA